MPAIQSRYQFSAHEHQKFLRTDAIRQIDFFQNSLRADGAFDALDFDGKPVNAPQELHVTTRLIHSYALAKKAGVEGCDDIIDAGMNALMSWHRDSKFGGYFWSVRGAEPVDDVKLAYGHVFVLLAASSAKQVNHPDADALLQDINDVIDRHFWDEKRGLLSDEFARDWTPFSNYRGMNANMHGTEAFLAAYEAKGEEIYLERAGRILEFFTGKIAPQYGERIPEHYNENWQVDENYEGNPVFRPRGTTPGHSFEMGRLLLQYWDLTGRKNIEPYNQARRLIEQAYHDGASKAGGIVYTLRLDGKVDRPARYWWPVTEGIGAYASLIKIEPHENHLRAYQILWQFADEYLIDHERGGWFPELDDHNKPASKQFFGKPDIYHALQADLFSLSAGVSKIFDNLPRL